MNAIRIHCISQENLERSFFAPNLVYQVKGKDMTFNNTLFDTVLFASAKDAESAHKFIQCLQNGCNDIMALLQGIFTQDARSVYSLLVNKKVIK